MSTNRKVGGGAASSQNCLCICHIVTRMVNSSKRILSSLVSKQREVCFLALSDSYLLGPAVAALSSPPALSAHSKQRHNKLWRQQPADDTDTVAEPSEFLPETLDGALDAQLPCLVDTTHPGLPRSLAPRGPSLPCCFRRLSDPLLLPHHENVGGLVHLEDLERDALLEEEAEPVEVPKLAQHPQEGTRLCEKDVKRKLEFGSPKARSGSLPQAEELEKNGSPRAGRWRRSSIQLDRSSLDQENLNNNNSKRSCPDDFEVGWGPSWEAACRAALPLPDL